MRASLHAEQHQKGMTNLKLVEELSKLPADDHICIVTSSDTAFTIKRIERITARSELTKTDIDIVRLHI